ncbi:hypothetical protein HOK51_06470 [Candidatus Woesearchaeota archaeon]|jgi:pyruvate/2-oxoacid:ferredoxin oxidoreductase beta subunit|nr:hypothetical protein [Candidatus Woesearchaeota archaeon]MBT6519468.1 hypothetical protein [Candidatus Woesearchaeota archaeon]MBT7368216.1 hypothetical protein [Candidatus Woesearchaeota archaeon]
MSPQKEKLINAIPEKEYFAQGHTACAGCATPIIMRHALKAAGKNTVVVNATGCLEVFSSPYPTTSWRVPWIHAAFENAAAVGSGVERALKKLNKKDTNILIVGGDGSTFDIGFQALSGAAERGHNFCYICYDNEAYMNCLSLDSLIMTKQGLKRITEIKKGDVVYAFNQKNHTLVLKKCTGVFDNGIKPVYELSTLHHSIKATSNHPFLTLKRQGRGKESFFAWKQLGQLKKDDEIVVLNKLNLGKSYEFKKLKYSKKGDYKVNKINELKIPKKSTPELMELLGLYVGDGWTRTHKAEVGFALPKNTKGSNKLKILHKKLFGKELIQKEKIYVYIYSVNFAKFIDSLGFGKGAKNKLIPDWVFTLPQKEKEAFVNGLMLSDGYIINKSHRYVSASYDLLKTLRLLLQTMNYRVGKIHQQTKKKGTHVVYRQLLEDSTYGYICFSKNKKPNTNKYLSQTKQRNFLADNKWFNTEKVISIKLIKHEPTLDLRVEGEHNFIADGIVVHNTGIQRSGATPKFASTTTSPLGKKVHGKTEFKKDMPFIMAAHKAYVAVTNVAFPHDLIKKIKKGLEFDGPAYIQVFSPCTTGWKFPPAITIELAKLAFKTRIYPMYEIENGVLRLSRKPSNHFPVENYLKLQGRFRGLTEKEAREIQEFVDEEWERLEKLDEYKLKLF